MSACVNCLGSECTNVREVIAADVEADLDANASSGFSGNMELPNFLWGDDLNVQFEHEEEV